MWHRQEQNTVSSKSWQRSINKCHVHGATRPIPHGHLTAQALANPPAGHHQPTPDQQLRQALQCRAAICYIPAIHQHQQQWLFQVTLLATLPNVQRHTASPQLINTCSSKCNAAQCRNHPQSMQRDVRTTRKPPALFSIHTVDASKSAAQPFKPTRSPSTFQAHLYCHRPCEPNDWLSCYGTFHQGRLSWPTSPACGCWYHAQQHGLATPSNQPMNAPIPPSAHNVESHTTATAHLQLHTGALASSCTPLLSAQPLSPGTSGGV